MSVSHSRFGAVDGELAVDQVAGWFRVRVTHGAAAASAHVQTADAGLAHEPGDPLLVHHQPQAEGQLGMHPR